MSTTPNSSDALAQSYTERARKCAAEYIAKNRALPLLEKFDLEPLTAIIAKAIAEATAERAESANAALKTENERLSGELDWREKRDDELSAEVERLKAWNQERAGQFACTEQRLATQIAELKAEIARLREQRNEAMKMLDSRREPIHGFDAMPDAGLPVRILEQYIGDEVIQSEPSFTGELMMKWQAERNAIIQKAISVLQSESRAAQLSDAVSMPTSVEQAELMQKVGYAWLATHRPDRLTELGRQLSDASHIDERVKAAVEPWFKAVDSALPWLQGYRDLVDEGADLRGYRDDLPVLADFVKKLQAMRRHYEEAHPAPSVNAPTASHETKQEAQAVLRSVHRPNAAAGTAHWSHPSTWEDMSHALNHPWPAPKHAWVAHPLSFQFSGILLTLNPDGTYFLSDTSGG